MSQNWCLGSASGGDPVDYINKKGLKYFTIPMLEVEPFKRQSVALKKTGVFYCLWLLDYYNSQMHLQFPELLRPSSFHVSGHVESKYLAFMYNKRFPFYTLKGC